MRKGKAKNTVNIYIYKVQPQGCAATVPIYTYISVICGNVVEREALVLAPRVVGNAHVVEARQEEQRADDEQWPHAVRVLSCQVQVV